MYRSALNRIRQSVLTVSIFRNVLLVSLAVFVLATSWGVYRERQHALEAAHHSAQVIALENLKSIGRELWNYDQAGWTADLEGMIQTPSIARIELFDTKTRVGVIQGGPERKVDSVWTVDVPAPNGSSLIGSLRVYESWSAADQQISGLIATMFVTEMVKIVGLSFALLVIVYLGAAKHLDQLANDVVQLDPRDLEAQLHLKRPHRNGRARDELDVLVTAINGFLQDRGNEVRRRAQVESDLIRAEGQTRELLEQTQQLLAQNKTILNNAVIGIVFLQGRRIISCNKRFEEIFQYPPGELAGSSTEILYESADFFEDIGRRAYAKAAEGENYTAEVRLKHKDGSPFWGSMSGRAIDPNNPQGGSIWVYSDISERKIAEDRINELAFYDPLTRLPNRTLLLDRMRHALAANARSGAHSAVLFVDLDHFKTINDTLGHEMGDRMLQQVAQRLLRCVRAEDTVARFGGDEFIVLLTGLSTSEQEAVVQTESVGQKLLAHLREVFLLDSVEYRMTPSIGITLFIDKPEDTDALIVQADMAMYRVKESGRNGARFFDPEMESAILQRAALETDLREAITQSQFVLEYQPQVDESQLVGAEALIRWQHPQRGRVMPDQFIGMAEETGLIVDLGYWVIEEACRQIVAWQSIPYLNKITVAVNVSVHQFHEADFVTKVQSIFIRTGIDPKQIKMELTESLFADDVVGIIEKMEALKSLGVSFSLDDFGTGFSSLAYLKRLPLDQLKIDKTFVRDVLIDPSDAAIAKTIIALAKSLGLSVVAEGVETEDQRGFLSAAGCGIYQGYLFSRSLTCSNFEQFAKVRQQQPENI